MKRGPKPIDVATRFWRLVDKRGDNECWPWQGYCTSKGYGRFNFGTKIENNIQRAHRVAFFLTYGRWPVLGMHTCDNPPCCNPQHVLDGTPMLNTHDMIRKGRDNFDRS